MNPTPAERVLWKHLRHNRAGSHFRRQYATGHYIVDFVCFSRKLIIEIDGPWHDLRSEREMRRTKFLESHGFRILRFSNEDVFLRTRQVIEEIRRALEDAESENNSDSNI